MRNTLPALLLIAAAGTAAATPLTPEEALARVLPRITKVAPKVGAPAEWQLAYTSKVPGHDDVNGCYVFKSHNGFMVASADDRTRALLGWSDDPQFDEESMSPEFKWWLEEYGREMHAALDDPAGGDENQIVTPEGPIGPLVKTHWNQFAPYNDMCPLFEGKHKVVTGCVATALAQVMKYHNWPVKGTGEHSYMWYGEKLTCDYETLDLDWDNMTDNYGRHSTAKENDAVAELMYVCGVTVNMHYHPGGSGASTGNIPFMMREHLDYAPSAYNARRPYYDLVDWNDLIYNSLKEDGPVQYSGFYGDGEGHSFVCDGYLEKGYFHINWGWGGANDGFFLLTGLRPEHKGHATTQGEGGFNFNQSAIVGLHPRNGGDEEAPVVLNLTGNFNVAQKWSEVGREVLARGGFWNASGASVVGDFGVRAVSEQGDTIYLPGREMKNYRACEYVGNYRFRLTDELKEGDYTLTPVFKTTDDGEWHTFNARLDCDPSEVMRVYMHDGKLHTHMLGDKSGTGIAASNFKIEGKVAPHRNFHVTATLENTSDTEWYGEVRVAAFTLDGKLIASGEPMMFDLPARSEDNVAFEANLSHVIDADALVDGPIHLYLVHNPAAPISEALDVNLEDTGVVVSVTQLAAERPALDGEVTVWSLTGHRVGTGDWSAMRPTLAKGLYIITDHAGNTIKVVIN